MNPFRWSYRVSYLVGFALCAALLAYALYAQYGPQHMDPCPLCISQRIAFMVMGIFFLLGGLHAPRGGGRWVYTVGTLLGALGGIATASRQLWLQSLPPDQVPSCGAPLAYLAQLHGYWSAKVLKLFFTGSGECAHVDPVWGLPMPAWTLIWYILLAFLAFYAAIRKRA